MDWNEVVRIVREGNPPPPRRELRTEEEWRARLSPDAYHVTRLKGTERPGTGEYNKHYEEGTYVCAGCGAPLFKSDFKFSSGCGWPSFWDELPGSVERHVDDSMGTRRTEITCANCGGHLGHEFLNEGFPNPKPIRHCVNSVSIKFEPGEK